MHKIIFKWTVFISLITMVNQAQASQENVWMQQKKSTMFSLVQANNLDKVALALRQGADVDQQDQQGRSLLLLAVAARNVDMAVLLVNSGADVNLQANNLDSPFLLAGASGQTNLVKLFLNHGARFDVFNRYGGTGLIPAAEKGHINTVKLLCQTPNYPIDHVNSLGWTALMEAVLLGDGSQIYQDIVRILKQSGCDINIPDKNGKTPLDYAKAKNYTNIVAILK